MKDLAVPFMLVCLAALILPAQAAGDPYEKIPFKEIFLKLIVRDREDRVYSGQIKSEKGLAAFSRKYALDFKPQGIDFKKHMLIFGITDNISTRAFRFLKRKGMNVYVLDYYETGLKYKLRMPETGKKYSYIQIFLTDRIEGIPHIAVKNFVVGGLSEVYE